MSCWRDILETCRVAIYEATYVALETDDIITMSQHVVRQDADVLSTCLPENIYEPIARRFFLRSNNKPVGERSLHFWRVFYTDPT